MCVEWRMGSKYLHRSSLKADIFTRCVTCMQCHQRLIQTLTVHTTRSKPIHNRLYKDNFVWRRNHNYLWNHHCQIIARLIFCCVSVRVISSFTQNRIMKETLELNWTVISYGEREVMNKEPQKISNLEHLYNVWNCVRSDKNDNEKKLIIGSWIFLLFPFITASCRLLTRRRHRNNLKKAI